MACTRDTRTADTYFNDLAARPVPTRAQTRALFDEYTAARDPAKKLAVRQKIAEGFLRFVVKRANRRTKDPELLLELISEGNLGLLRAIELFEPERGNAFLTYATPWIEAYIREFLNHLGPAHVPSSALKAFRKARRAEDDLIAQGALREYTLAELGSVAGTDPAALPDAVDTHHGRAFDVMEYLQRAELPRREMLILIWHFGVRSPGHELSFDEIADLFYRIDGSEMTSERVRQLKEKALLDLRQQMKDVRIERAADVA